MSTATVFRFVAVTVDTSRRTVSCQYEVVFDNAEPLVFCEKLTFPLPLPSSPVTDRLLNALLIGLGISYYKAYLPPVFEVPRPLSPHEATFWNATYLGGLGEFLYVNQLAPSRLARFEADNSVRDTPEATATAEQVVLALGGGKDSIVAGELLKRLGLPLHAYVLGTEAHQGQTGRVARDMGVELWGVQRRLDPLLLEVNKRPGVYNGHVPISMVFALCGLLLCVASESRYLVVANEAAASLPHTTWQGMDINHQWSKSLTFEKALQDFVHATISPDLWYFSAIRPLSSLAVAKLFASHPAYFMDFTSCNRVFAIDPATRPNDRWCGVCAKCLSSFIILAPWLPAATLTEIFGKNLLDNQDLLELFQSLAGWHGHRPLDCVGTEEEIQLSLKLIESQGKFSESVLMKTARDHQAVAAAHDLETATQAATTPNDEHAFPPELAKSLSALLRETNA